MARVRLADLVRAHEGSKGRRTLARSFGDGYLYERSRVHRAVRDEVLRLGYRFTRDDFCDYRALSLAALPAILKAKRIPYLDNATPLLKVERRCPRVFDLDTLLVPAKNTLLHESAHCLADATFDRLRGPRGIVLRAILGEATANTAERLASYEVKGEVHRFFHNVSSFHEIPGRPLKPPIARAVRASDPRVIAKTLFFSFVHANFLYKTVGREELARVRAHIGGDPKLLLPVFREGMGLSVIFRVRTQRFFFRYHHALTRSLFELTDFDFVDELERHPRVLAQIDQLACILTGGRG